MAQVVPVVEAVRVVEAAPVVGEVRDTPEAHVHEGHAHEGHAHEERENRDSRAFLMTRVPSVCDVTRCELDLS